MTQKQDNTGLDQVPYVRLLLGQDHQDLKVLDGTTTHSPAVAKAFLRTLQRQTQRGQETYRRYLFPWNQRDQAKDAKEEMVDAFVYLCMLEAEHQYLLDLLARIILGHVEIEKLLDELPTGLYDALINRTEVTRDNKK